jgi:hypothetical protein
VDRLCIFTYISQQLANLKIANFILTADIHRKVNIDFTNLEMNIYPGWTIEHIVQYAYLTEVENTSF